MDLRAFAMHMMAAASPEERSLLQISRSPRFS